MPVLPERSDRHFDIRVNACQLQPLYEGNRCCEQGIRPAQGDDLAVLTVLYSRLAGG